MSRILGPSHYQRDQQREAENRVWVAVPNGEEFARTADEIAAIVGITYERARIHLSRLKNRAKVKRKRAGIVFVYWRAR